MNDNTLEGQRFPQPCRRLEFGIKIDNQEASKRVDDQEGSKRVDDEEASQDVPFNTDEKLDEEPKLGMEFTSDESAYDFYNKYARKIGFSIRKSTVKTKDDKIIRKRVFCCSKEGKKRDNKQIHQPKVIRAITRTQCLASMTIRLQMNGRYSVTKFVAEHNHEVATPMKVHMLRSHRGLTNAQKDEVNTADDSGLKPKETLEYLSRQYGGREKLGFLPIDYKNYLRKKRMKAMEKGDAGAVLEYFQKMKVEDPSFFYAIQVDEDDLITNMFWADGKSIVDYSVFGDVICFDTTYRINNYGRPFAPFVGVNHHKQTVIFGAALLYDETIESFKWLFQTFFSAMSEKQPKTILTDQDAAMANAIASVMPGTCHRLCIWHIYQNAAKHLSQVFAGSQGLKSDFNMCVYDYEVEEEFLIAWNNMLEKYDLRQNKWLHDLFKEREKWALVYGRNTFCADMKSTQRSESMNSLLKKYLNSKYDLLRFFTHYERVVAERRYQELSADFKMRQSTPVIFLDVTMLKEAAKVYTPEVFAMFQDEYKKIYVPSIFKCGEFGTVTEFQIIGNNKDKGRTVRYDSLSSTMMCSCKKFEFVGILCSHALKVLDWYNIKALPPQYILKRWQREAKAGFATNRTGLAIQGDQNVTSGKRYTYLCRKLLKIAAMAAEHDEVFKVVDRNAEKLYDEAMECMKSINQPPVMLSKVDDESVNTEHAHLKPTESGETEREHSEPTGSVDIQCARSEFTEAINSQSTRHVPSKNQVTFADSLRSQTASGIRLKKTVRGGHHIYKNPLDKVKKKRFRTKSIQPQANEERLLMQQAPNSMHHPSFTVLQSNHFNQGSHIAVISTFGLPSGSHGGHGHHMVMGDTPELPSGSINVPLSQLQCRLPNVSIPQQNPLNIGSQIPRSGGSAFMSGPFTARGYDRSTNLYQQVPSSSLPLVDLRQDLSKGTILFSQPSPLCNNNQPMGSEDHHL